MLKERSKERGIERREERKDEWVGGWIDGTKVRRKEVITNEGRMGGWKKDEWNEERKKNEKQN